MEKVTRGIICGALPENWVVAKWDHGLNHPKNGPVVAQEVFS